MEFIEIKEFPNYLISKNGEIRNKKTNYIIKSHISNGYPTVSLFNKKSYKRKLHRVLAIQFINNPDNLDFVNHKDGNKTNYNLDNLEWVTKSENTQHAVETKLITTRKINQYDLKWNLIKKWENSKQVSDMLKINYRVIYNAARRGNITGNFRWKFETEKVRNHPKYNPLKNEIWKIIYSNYKISNFGNVWTMKSNRLLSPYVNSSGYLCIKFSIDGVRKTSTIHKLVGTNFVPNCGENLIINHKDGNKLNNYFTNLEWVTYSENNKHSIKNKMTKYDNVKTKILCIDSKTKAVIKTYESISAVSKEYNLHRTTIYRYIKKNVTLSGVMFRYK